MSKIHINNPNEIDWAEYWTRMMDNAGNRGKDWTKAAKVYRKIAEKDNYTEKLIENMILDKNDTVIDVGCGEGSVTVPLSKYVSKITASDLTEKMLDILKNRIEEEHINNIEIIQEDINNITAEKYGHYDIVLGSRVVNGIRDINQVILNLNEIANKYVFLSVFGVNNWKIEKDFYKHINKEYNDRPEYTVLVNILANLGIYANVKNLNVGPSRTYDSIDDALKNGKWDSQKLSKEEKEQLREYLEENLTLNPDTQKLENKHDKPDWVLIWWKVEK